MLSACLAAAGVIVPRVSAQTGEAARPFRESVFTAEQADRGQRLYAARCAGCHGENLLGIEMAPALAGANFPAPHVAFRPLRELTNPTLPRSKTLSPSPRDSVTAA